MKKLIIATMFIAFISCQKSLTTKQLEVKTTYETTNVGVDTISQTFEKKRKINHEYPKP